MNTINDKLSALRVLLAEAEPSLLRWLEVCALAQDIGDVGISYAQEHLIAWPERWRSVETQGIELRRKSLHQARLSFIDLTDANLKGTDFSEANLSGADISGADISYAKLNKANLTGTVMRHLRQLRRRTLSGADFTDATLQGADLTASQLFGTRFDGTDLTGANLVNTDLSQGQFLKARLIDAKLTGANLSWARLTGADLSGADLSGADLSYTIFARAFYDYRTLWPSNFDVENSGAVMRYSET